MGNMRNTNPSKTVPIYLISTDLIRVMTIRPCFLLTSIQRKTEYFHNLWKKKKNNLFGAGAIHGEFPLRLLFILFII